MNSNSDGIQGSAARALDGYQGGVRLQPKRFKLTPFEKIENRVPKAEPYPPIGGIAWQLSREA